ncbi:MAG: sigma-70 family RNA polymerase sigma factor [Desulfobulbus sp.]|nr:sigma-70 family RNA polymerase sigma factor [Desulfobulbus sp.]
MNAPIADQPYIDQDIWAIAMEWVGSHMRIVHWVADPYLPYMTADEDDLFQEAVMAAVEALVVARKKNSPQQLTSFFRVILKTRCLKMAAGIRLVHFPNDSLPCTVSQKEEEPLSERHPAEIEKALQRVGGRKQEICTWILHQSRPVSTLEIARHFNVSQRQVCRLLRHTLLQLTKAA